MGFKWRLGYLQTSVVPSHIRSGLLNYHMVRYKHKTLRSSGSHPPVPPGLFAYQPHALSYTTSSQESSRRLYRQVGRHIYSGVMIQRKTFSYHTQLITAGFTAETQIALQS
jgi:hypothetical protein